MAIGIRTGDPPGFNKGHSSKFREDEDNNKDEDNSPKTLNDKKNKIYLVK